MPKPIRVLLLEDRPADAALIIHELRRAGFEPLAQRVETEAEYLACLDPTLDLILADFALPQFDALHALSLLQKYGMDIPFIVITGSLEEAALECMRQGATDYLLKDRLARLGPAVTCALHQNALRIEKQQTDIALRESEALNRAVLSSLASHIAVLDQNGVIVVVNRNWERFARDNGGDMHLEYTGIGVNYLTVCQKAAESGDELARQVLKGIQAVLSGKQAHFSFEYPCHSPQEQRWFTMNVTPLDGTNGGVVVAHENITERKRLEAQFLQVQKLESIGRLAGGIAHDFNNLLTAMTGYVDLALATLPPENDVYSDLSEIQKAVRRASTLTQQLLAFARKQIIEPHIINLNSLIDDMNRLLRRLLTEDIELVMRLDPELGQIKVDPGQFEQVIVNMAVNAADAMPSGGRFVIETTNILIDESYVHEHIQVAPGQYVLLTISDTGVGMDAKVKQLIFEPFFTTKEAGRGTGLGLSTCYGIVKQNGGYIWVYSEIGHGTTFKIYLPRVDAPVEDFARPSITQAIPQGTETILLVEDEAAVRQIAARTLRAQGYTVIEAANGTEALQITHTHPGAINLILTDVVMPSMGGGALVEQLKALYPAIKMLFTSGYTDDTIVHHGQLKPGVQFIQKPFSPAALARKVRDVLDS
jgi:signal transduction histidine kinase/response regulator RpfG family c-di-GMP phosphodiesterase